MMRQAVEEVGREKMREKEMEKGMLMREKNMKEATSRLKRRGVKRMWRGGRGRWEEKIGRAC